MPAHREQNEVSTTIYAALERISHSGNYQKWLMLFMMWVTMVSAFSTFGSPFVFMNPKFECQGSQGFVSEHYACGRLTTCHLRNDYTITASAELYCGGRANDRNLVQAAFGIGAITGVFLLNCISSFLGRLISLRIALTMGCIHSYSLLVGVYSESTVWLVLSQVLGGATHQALWIMGLLYLNTYSKEANRDKVCGLLGLFANAFLVALFCWALPHWQYLAYFLVFGYTASIICSIFILEEDPLYYYHSHKFDELRALLERVAKFNGASNQDLEVSWQDIQSLRAREEESKETYQTNQTKVSFVTCSLVMKVLVLLCFQISYDTVFYGNNYQLKDFSISPSLSQIAMGAGDVVGCVFLALGFKLCTDRIGRANTTSIVTVLLISFCAVFLTNFPQNSTIGTIVSLFMFRMLAYVFFGSFAQFWSTSFPKVIENICIGCVTGVGAMGQVIAPLAIRVSEQSHTNAFVYWMILLGVLALVPSAFLPRK